MEFPNLKALVQGGIELILLFPEWSVDLPQNASASSESTSSLLTIQSLVGEMFTCDSYLNSGFSPGSHDISWNFHKAPRKPLGSFNRVGGILRRSLDALNRFSKTFQMCRKDSDSDLNLVDSVHTW